MKIKVGDTVELNNGDVHEVDRMIGETQNHVDVHGYGPFVINGMRYHQSGKFGSVDSTDAISVKRIISRAADETLSSQEGEPKPWKELTDEEKGALLLAHHEGKVIEYYSPTMQKWIYEKPPFFIKNLAYRVKPEPRRITVDLMADFKTIGTIDLIDGKPDYSTIQMEEL